MRHDFYRSTQSSLTAFACGVGAAIAAGLFSIAAQAQPFEPHVTPFLGLDEVRIGVLAANLDEGGSEDATTLINGELLFGRPGRSYADPIWNYFLRPRPHIGFSVTPDDGTSQVYAGVTWDAHLTDRLFFETSFGGTLHDGPTDSDDPNSYGCSLLFRESASIGYELTEHLRVMATVDHMSNAGLCDQNQGLTNAGVRLGYRW